MQRWAYGDAIVRREIAWGRPWCAMSEIVVEDTDERFVTYIPEGAPLAYAPGPWPTATGLHPWYPKESWQGEGVLTAQRPGDAYSVWHFWTGPERTFASWYLNLQAPFQRTAIGYDTGDHELDIVVLADGQWFFKDEAELAVRVQEGRYSREEEAEIRAEGRRLGAMIEAGDPWWGTTYTDWRPDPSWARPPPPRDWLDLGPG